MSRPMIRIYTEPGVFIDREMNDEEFAQHQKDKAEYEAQLAIENQIKAKRAEVEAKLATLGLTSDDLKALGL